jgi:hypothetical protein
MRSLNVRSHSRAIVQRSFTPHGLEVEENGIEVNRELPAVNNGYGSTNEQAAAWPDASSKNIRMAVARSSAGRGRMLDAAGSSAA